jgi:hypothetical protein
MKQPSRNYGVDGDMFIWMGQENNGEEWQTAQGNSVQR